MGKVTMLKPDGSQKSVTWNEEPALEELQAMVGGSIQLVPGFETFEGEDATVYCNEEGEMLDLEINHAATDRWASALGHEVLNDPLLGNVVIVQGFES